MTGADDRDPIDVDPEEWRNQFWPNNTGAPGLNLNGAGNLQDLEPIPLVDPHEAEAPYPMNALPGLMRDAILEYVDYGKQPISMVATSALSNTSLVTQGLADVARDEHLIGPISLYTLDIGVSGERKTSGDNWFKRAAREWMIGQRLLLQPAVSLANAELAAWNAAYEGLVGKIKTASGKPASEKQLSVTELKQQLVELEKDKPTTVVEPHLFYEDTNHPTLAPDLANGWPSASLWSDEGGLVVGGHGMNDDMAMAYFGLLNRLWDGNPFDRDRASARRAHMRGRRFTVSLMMQPLVMARLLSLAGGASRGMGLIARFLLVWPTSTMGTRMCQPAKDAMPASVKLRARYQELLNVPLPIDPANPGLMVLSPPVLQLTDRAKRIWQAFHNDVESELGKDGEYAEIADIGAKTAENAVRIAGNFHVLLHGPTGEIDSKEMRCAAQVAYWYLLEARRILAAFDKPRAISDAEILLRWLLKQPPGDLDPREILRIGPKALGREKQRRDEAIAVLVDHSYLLPQATAPGIGKRYRVHPHAKDILEGETDG